MNSLSRLFLLSVLLLVVSGCLKQDRTGQDHAEASLPDFEQMVLNDYIQPYKTGDIESWLDVFADDAVGMHNTLPALEGKRALRGFAETVHSTFNIEQLDVSVDSVTRSGDWVLTRGNFTAHFVLKQANPGEQSEPQQGKYVLLWERQDDGTWKIILDMGNSNTR